MNRFKARFNARFKPACAALWLLAGAASAGPIAVVVNKDAATPTQSEIADVYLGKSQSFKPLDGPDGSALRADFYRKLTGRDPAQIKSMWSRVVFTGKGSPPREAADAAAMKAAIAADPKAIGYLDKAAVDGSVKVVLTLE
jgi:ABC-type phosphate transport system substrate-binding protein